MIRSGLDARVSARLKGAGFIAAAGISIAMVVAPLGVGAVDEQCGPESIDDMTDLQSAITAFVSGGTCSVITLSRNITVNAPLNIYAIDDVNLPRSIGRSLTIDGNGFTLSATSSTSGFVIFLGGIVSSTALTVRDLHMTGFGGSGALSVISGSTTIERSSFTDNAYAPSLHFLDLGEASAGAVNAFSHLTIVDSEFSGNTGSAGGAVFNSPNLYLELGLASSDGPPLQISGSTFVGNVASSAGGAIYALQSMLMVNSTVTSNEAASAGGVNVAGSVTINFCTIVGNTSSSNRAAVSAKDDITITNSILFANVLKVVDLPDVPSDVSGDQVVTITSSLLTSLQSVESTLSAATLDGSNIIGENPLLSPLADYGGFRLPGGSVVRTRVPQAGSPVIDTIDLIAVGNGDGPTDQRGAGFPRFVNGLADMGAVEYWPVAVPETPTDSPYPLPDYSWSLNGDRWVSLPDTK